MMQGFSMKAEWDQFSASPDQPQFLRIVPLQPQNTSDKDVKGGTESSHLPDMKRV